MEPDASEDLLRLQEHIAELLDNMCDIGTIINRKSNALLHEIRRNTKHADANHLEVIGMKMIKMVNILNINVADITGALETNFKEVHESSSEQLFNDLLAEMLKYKKSLLAIATNANISLHKDAQNQTEFISEIVLSEDVQTEPNNSPSINNLPQPDIESALQPAETYTDFENSLVKNMVLSKDINLGLKRTDTQETEDDWVDSINRSPTGLDLWNIQYKGDKIKATDEYLNKMKEEDDVWDRQTEDLNYDSDDPFIDEQSPKAETEPLSGSLKEESMVVEQPELPNISDTAQLKISVPKGESIDINSTDTPKTDPEEKVEEDCSDNLSEVPKLAHYETLSEDTVIADEGITEYEVLDSVVPDVQNEIQVETSSADTIPQISEDVQEVVHFPSNADDFPDESNLVPTNAIPSSDDEYKTLEKDDPVIVDEAIGPATENTERAEALDASSLNASEKTDDKQRAENEAVDTNNKLVASVLSEGNLKKLTGNIMDEITYSQETINVNSDSTEGCSDNNETGALTQQISELHSDATKQTEVNIECDNTPKCSEDLLNIDENTDTQCKTTGLLQDESTVVAEELTKTATSQDNTDSDVTDIEEHGDTIPVSESTRTVNQSNDNASKNLSESITDTLSPELTPNNICVDENKTQSVEHGEINNAIVDDSHNGTTNKDVTETETTEEHVNELKNKATDKSNDSSEEHNAGNASTNSSFIFDFNENSNNIDQLGGGNKANNDCVDPTLKSNKAEDSHSGGTNGEAIEIVSDSDDSVQLDVVMEELISDEPCVNVDNENDAKVIKQETIKEESQDAESIKIQDDEIEKCEEELKSQADGEELLELLREVKVPSVTPPVECSRGKQKPNSKEEIKDADEIYQMLLEDSISDISDSDDGGDDDSVSLSSDAVEDYIDKSKIEFEEQAPQYDENELWRKYNIRNCYVAFEKLQIDLEANVVLTKPQRDNSVDRLCDITGLITKRKLGDVEDKRCKSKKVKKPVGSTKGTSDSESLSDFSHSDSDNSVHSTSLNNLTLDSDQKLDDALAKEICNGFDNSFNESIDIDSDNSDKTSKNEKNGDDGKTICNDVSKKEKLSKEERQKKAWKNDPLLRGKLTSDDSTDTSSSDTDKSIKKRKSLKTKYEHDTDFNIISDESGSETDIESNKLNKFNLDDKLVSPIKKNVPLDSDTDTDSDIEIISPKHLSPEKNAPEDGLGPGSSQKGRRNIRALMSEENLAEATQRANREEQERIERLEDRIKIKESLSQSFSQSIEEDELILDVDGTTGEPLIKVNQKLTTILKPHQKSGVQFMWDSCYESLERVKADDGSGCILAHCMGLGKTLQVLTLIHTLFAYEETKTKHVLIVCPLSTVNNWKKEVRKTFRDFSEKQLNVLTIAGKKEVSQKYDIVKKWKLRKKSVLVVGYEGFETLTNELKLEKVGCHLKERMMEALIDPGPDLVVCDEGHLLRNKKALKTLALNKIKTKRRIVLTGTPLQNNLMEYYYMVNFVKPNLLGNIKEYKTNFVNPITNGQYEDSTAEDIKLMMKRTHVLHKLLKKTIQRVEDGELKIYLPKMVDHAIFIQLNQLQVDLYNKFSTLCGQNSESANKKCFLSDFCTFQYICTHPHLLSIMETLRNKKIKERDLITNEHDDNLVCNLEGWWKALMPLDAKEKIEYGNKLMVLKSILEECEEIKDKVLIFSQSLGELDLIEHFLQKVGTVKCSSWKKQVDYFRMDGTVPPASRSNMCDLFNDKLNEKLRLLLMSTKVGGLGLNLTAANRIIIMTVNWNPSYDTQSVFRAYRFGQEKEVYVYRLIALDSMEEKVYQRTVTKLAIAHRVVDKHQITRHYKSMDLQELYSCKPNADIERPISNVPEDKVLAKLILKLPYIFKHHEHQALLANRPEDNLNEHELNAAWDEFKRIKDAPQMAMPPPQQQKLPHVSVPAGPTFAMAYNLSKGDGLETTEGNGKNLGEELLKCFNPYSKLKTSETESVNELTKIPKSIPKRIFHKIPLQNQSKTGVTSGQNKPMTDVPEQDPLYIPLLSENTNSRISYGEMLNKFNQKTVTMLSNPATSIELDKLLDNGTSGDNGTSRIPQPIIILDDEPNNSSNGTPNKSVIKRFINAGSKRKNLKNDSSNRAPKRMRNGFNTSNSSLVSINLEDDTESVVTDTTSESGSLSNEVLANFGLNGITIRKVVKESKRNSDVITLD